MSRNLYANELDRFNIYIKVKRKSFFRSPIKTFSRSIISAFFWSFFSRINRWKLRHDFRFRRKNRSIHFTSLSLSHFITDADRKEIYRSIWLQIFEHKYSWESTTDFDFHWRINVRQTYDNLCGQFCWIIKLSVRTRSSENFL